MAKSKMLAAAAAGCVLATGANAQVSSFGNACAGGSGTTPTLTTDTAPIGGTAFNLEVEGPPTTACILVVGASNTLWGGIPLPLDLSFLPAPGCDLNVSFDFSIAFGTDGNGEALIPATLNNTSVPLYLQVLAIDPALDFSTILGISEGLSVQASPAPSGEIIVSEIMNNPDSVGDSDGEWFELYNTTGSAIDLEGWTIEDEDSDSHTIDAGGAGVIIPAGGYAVLSVNDDLATNGNVPVDYVFPQAFPVGIFLSNSSDELVVRDPSGDISDIVRWDGSWPLGSGVSAALNVTNLNGTDNDDVANWSAGSCQIADCNADLGTPGYANDMCVTGTCPPPPMPTELGDVIVVEFIQNPAAVGDGDGEWFEVFNTTAGAIDMNGWTIQDADTDSHVIDNGGPLMIAAGGRLVFGNNAVSGVNGGVTVDYQYSGVFLGNGTDEIELLDGAMNLQDAVNYDNGATFPDGNGASASFDPSVSQDETTNNDGANWCLSTSVYGDGDLGTPGAVNDSCAVAKK